MKVRTRFLILLAVAIIAGIATGVSVYSRSPDQQIKKQLALGERYLSELKYEEAIAVFNSVIEIAPGNPDPYMGLAQAYVGQGDYDKAMDVAHDGYEMTNSQSLIVLEADICIEYVEELEKNKDWDNALRILEERYRNTADERLATKKKQIEEKLRIEQEEAERKAKEEAEAAAAAAEEAKKKECIELMQKIAVEIEKPSIFTANVLVDELEKNDVFNRVEKIIIDSNGIMDDHLSGKGTGVYHCSGVFSFEGWTDDISNGIMVYIGDFSNGVRKGDGVQILYTDGQEGVYCSSCYDGEWDDDMPNGNAKYTVIGDNVEVRDEGEFVNGRPNGQIKHILSWPSLSEGGESNERSQFCIADDVNPAWIEAVATFNCNNGVPEFLRKDHDNMCFAIGNGHGDEYFFSCPRDAVFTVDGFR